MSRKKPIFTGVEWDLDLINKLWTQIDKIGKSYGLDYLQPQIEIVTADQMIENTVAIGLPTIYDHWSLGKDFTKMSRDYKNNMAGLAYEMIINSDPPIAYIMENNSATTQCLVLAHACVGHADFFKNNYLFKLHTDPDTILSYCKYAKDTITKLEQKLGSDAVESLLDAAHSLRNHGVDSYVRDFKPKETEQSARERRSEHEVKSYNPLHKMMWDHCSQWEEDGWGEIFQARSELEFPEENILYFIQKYAPRLTPEEREVISIVRHIRQYFFPQSRTKLMNEGWASFWHYTIMNDLFDGGHIDEGTYLEFLHLHTGVLTQHDFDQGQHSLNPYTLGFAMFKDIKRICENPTEEDKKYFPVLANTDWLEQLKFARENFIDSSFIMQYLSPKLVRDFRLFSIESSPRQAQGSMRYDEVSSDHSDEEYQKIKRILADQYDFAKLLPHLEIIRCDLLGDRVLTIKYTNPEGVELDLDSANNVLAHIGYLWGYEVKILI